jgi:hypothetical protein
LSRLYARYLLGDLTLTSCEGYGTDAYVFLKAMSEDANEMLPVFNHSSTRQYRSPMPSRDWVKRKKSAQNKAGRGEKGSGGKGKAPVKVSYKEQLCETFIINHREQLKQDLIKFIQQELQKDNLKSSIPLSKD